MNKKISVIIVTYNRKNDVDLCLQSIFNSTYNNYEIIVVDNASEDDTVMFLENKYSNSINLIKSPVNLNAGGGRNLGAKNASGDYFLFIDSDNVIDFNMINELYLEIEKGNNCGMIGPLMYYYEKKNIIWLSFANINMWTSKSKYEGNLEEDKGQYNLVRETGHLPNVFMVRKNIWELVNGIDEIYGIMYEESDLAEKIKKIGYKILITPKAKTYHNTPMSYSKDLEFNNKRFYYTTRNRIIFMRKNATKIQLFVFYSIFMHVLNFYYFINILKFGKLNIISTFFSAIKDGVTIKIEK